MKKFTEKHFGYGLIIISLLLVLIGCGSKERYNFEVIEDTKDTVVVLPTKTVYTNYIVGDYDDGRELFRQYCRACHELSRDMIGPVISTHKKPLDEIINYIKNPVNDINKQQMPSYADVLTDPEINDILYYIQQNDQIQFTKIRE